MNPAGIYEPDKYWSACQAFLIMLAMVIPMALQFEFERTLTIAAPLEVTIVTAPPQTVFQEQQAVEIQQQLEQQLSRQRDAELARRRAEELKQQEELRLAEQRRQEEEARRLEQERLAAELEQQRLLEEQQRQAEQEEQERLEQERLRQEQLEADRIAAEKAAAEQAAALEAERLAAIKAKANAVIINRYTVGIHNQVQRHLANPDDVTADLLVEIKIVLGDDGHLVSTPEIINKSGHEKFDEQAIRAILQSGREGFSLPDDPELREQFREIIMIIKPKVDN